MKILEAFLTTVAILGGVVLLLVAVISFSGCDGGIPIGEAPTCVDLVTDECVPEVIEEFCPPAPEFECPEGYICLTRAEFDEYSTGLCEFCEDQVECPAPPRKKPVRKPHRNTRGKGHQQHKFDLKSNDPLEGLELSQNCTTQCFQTPGGLRCYTTCTEAAYS